MVWIRERDWLPLGVAFVGLIGLTLVATQSRRFGFPEDDEDGDGLDPPARGVGWVASSRVPSRRVPH